MMAASSAAANDTQATSGESVVAMIAEHFPNKFKTMKAIAKCESGLVHRENGKLLPNREGSPARGAFQVLMSVHGPEMKRLGLDPNDDDDYMTYVQYLVDNFGLSPWAESKPCWQHAVS
jgi:hypothetical protein